MRIAEADENHADDGVFISADNGATWYLVDQLVDYPELVYVSHQIDLDQAIVDAGISFTDQFLIKFQNFDNCNLGIDGYSFDDICVQSYPPNLANSSKSGADVALNGEVFDYTVLINNTGRVTATGTTMVDQVPAGTALAGTPTATGGMVAVVVDEIQWSGDVAANGMVTVAFPVTVTGSAGTTITNTASIAHPDLLTVTVQALTDIVAAEPELEVGFVGRASRQTPDMVMTNTVALDNVGFANLSWILTDCVPASDIPWLSASPVSGTIARDAASAQMELVFDSTGLDSGVYGGDLCFSTNNTVEPEVKAGIFLVVDPDTSGESITFTDDVFLSVPSGTISATGTIVWRYEVLASSSYTGSLWFAADPFALRAFVDGQRVSDSEFEFLAPATLSLSYNKSALAKTLTLQKIQGRYVAGYGRHV